MAAAKAVEEMRPADGVQEATLVLDDGSVVMGDLSELGIVGQEAPEPIAPTTVSSLSRAATPAAPSAPATPVSAKQARAALAMLPTDAVRGLVRDLGGAGQGSRSALVEFCVARRIGGPQRAKAADG